jgi:hypothetical protein
MNRRSNRSAVFSWPHLPQSAGRPHRGLHGKMGALATAPCRASARRVIAFGRMKADVPVVNLKPTSPTTQLLVHERLANVLQHRAPQLDSQARAVSPCPLARNIHDRKHITAAELNVHRERSRPMAKDHSSLASMKAGLHRCTCQLARRNRVVAPRCSTTGRPAGGGAAQSPDGTHDHGVDKADPMHVSSCSRSQKLTKVGRFRRQRFFEESDRHLHAKVKIGVAIAEGLSWQGHGGLGVVAAASRAAAVLVGKVSGGGRAAMLSGSEVLRSESEVGEEKGGLAFVVVHHSILTSTMMSTITPARGTSPAMEACRLRRWVMNQIAAASEST